MEKKWMLEDRPLNIPGAVRISKPDAVILWLLLLVQSTFDLRCNTWNNCLPQFFFDRDTCRACVNERSSASVEASFSWCCSCIPGCLVLEWSTFVFVPLKTRGCRSIHTCPTTLGDLLFAVLKFLMVIKFWGRFRVLATLTFQMLLNNWVCSLI